MDANVFFCFSIKLRKKLSNFFFFYGRINELRFKASLNF